MDQNKIILPAGSGDWQSLISTSLCQGAVIQHEGKAKAVLQGLRNLSQ